jgi:hypothetical protein
MKRIIKIVIMVSLVISGLGAEDKGYEIAKKSDELKEPQTRIMVGSMKIVDQSGTVRARKMNMSTRKMPGGDASFIDIKEPADVAGTKFLSIPVEGGETDQRLYLPALKKVRKIASGGKTGEFVNSDFSYYDLEDHQFSDFTYKFLSEGDTIAAPAFAGMKFYRVESVPKKTTAPYSKTILWINMDDFFTYRIEAFDKADDSHWKTISVTKVEKMNDMLIGTQTLLENRKRGSKTTLQASNIRIDAPLPANAFSVKALEQ